MAKRVFDVVVSSALLIVLSPLMLILACVVLIAMGRPIIFRQVRPGLRGRPFTIYKFRCMTNERDENGELLPDDKRLTKAGMILNATSLNELPGLFNVLKGDMSLVGPRPLLLQYLDKYTPEQARRHEVKPGITGYAQVKGRHSVPFSKRLAMDVYYVDHRSFWLDVKILLATVPAVLFRRGLKHQNQAREEVDDIGLLAGTRWESPPAEQAREGS